LGWSQSGTRNVKTEPKSNNKDDEKRAHPEKNELINEITSNRDTPRDMAEYIFWTGDEHGVTSAIKDFVEQGLVNYQHSLYSFSYQVPELYPGILFTLMIQRMKKISRKMISSKSLMAIENPREFLSPPKKSNSCVMFSYLSELRRIPKCSVAFTLSLSLCKWCSIILKES